MKIAYLDLIGGASGDMLIGALLDAGLPLDELRSALDGLNVSGFSIETSAVTRAGINATQAHVVLDEEGRRRRGWEEFESAITGSSLSDPVKSRSLEVFDLLARAEAAAHGVGRDDVHLHELGTVDTLVDVVGFIAGLELLGIDRVHASAFPLSTGTSRSSHGVMAATSNATAEIYRMTAARVESGIRGGLTGEAVTPTGAALVATVASFAPASLNVETRGSGAGERDPESYPNVVSIWIGETMDPGETESGLVLLETNIDDMTAETLAAAAQSIMEAGALDAWLAPVLMKKGRPGNVFSVLCRAEDESLVVRRLFEETTTLGIRRREIERFVAPRRKIRVRTDYGEVTVKVREMAGAPVNIHPEFEECSALAREHGVPVRQVIAAAAEAADAIVRPDTD